MYHHPSDRYDDYERGSNLDQQAFKLSCTLADPTRFSIYQHIVRSRETVTVQDIADRFSIHPNVARLHLTKLEDAELLTSTPEKGGKGRPGRVYSLSEKVINLQFPPRNYQLLADIAIESLISLGDTGEAMLVQMGHRFGVEAAKQAMQAENIDPNRLSRDAILEFIYCLVVAQGLNPDIQATPEGHIRFRVYNCTFSGLAKRYPKQVCKMHNAMLTGIFETFFGKIELREDESMQAGCQSCAYTIIQLPHARVT
jgi:predicted ArsR family transcriptional regulator